MHDDLPLPTKTPGIVWIFFRWGYPIDVESEGHIGTAVALNVEQRDRMRAAVVEVVGDDFECVEFRR